MASLLKPLLCCLALFLAPLGAQGLSVAQPDEVAALMTKHWSGLNTFSAQFREIYRGQVRSGTLVFKKPSLMRVRYQADGGAGEMDIVVGKKKMYVYLKQLNVVSEQEMTAETGAEDLTVGPMNAYRLSRLYYFNFVDAKTPVGFFKNSDEADRFHLPEKKDREGTGWRVSLSPRDITSGLERLELWVDGDGAVRRTRALTVDDRLMDLFYFNIRRNETVGDKEFDFDVPASAQVVKNALLRPEHTEAGK